MAKKRETKQDTALCKIEFSSRLIDRLTILIEYIRQNKGTLDLDFHPNPPSKPAPKSKKIAQELVSRFISQNPKTKSVHEEKLFHFARKMSCALNIAWSMKMSETQNKRKESSNVTEAVGRAMPYVLNIRFSQPNKNEKVFKVATLRLSPNRSAGKKFTDEELKAQKQEDRDITKLNKDIWFDGEKPEKTKNLVKNKETYQEHNENIDTVTKYGFFVEGGEEATKAFLSLCDAGERERVQDALKAIDQCKNVLQPLATFVAKMEKAVHHLIEQKFLLDPRQEHDEEEEKKCEHYCGYHCPSFINVKALSLSGRPRKIKTTEEELQVVKKTKNNSSIQKKKTITSKIAVPVVPEKRNPTPPKTTRTSPRRRNSPKPNGGDTSPTSELVKSLQEQKTAAAAAAAAITRNCIFEKGDPKPTFQAGDFSLNSDIDNLFLQ